MPDRFSYFHMKNGLQKYRDLIRKRNQRLDMEMLGMNHRYDAVFFGGQFCERNCLLIYEQFLWIHCFDSYFSLGVPCSFFT